jgi:hypothetical protein
MQQVGLLAALPAFRADVALSFEPSHKSFFLEHHVDGLDNSNLWICFAIENDLMLKLLRAGYIKEMFLSKTIIPATIPSGQPIGILLPSTGQRGAG